METTHYILSPLKPGQLSFQRLLVLMAATVVVGLAFGAVYQYLDNFFESPWLGAAIFHSLASIGILWMSARRGEVKSLLQSNRELGLRTYFLYLPSGIVVGGVLLGGVASALLGNAVKVTPDWYPQLAFVLWVPIVEEIVFRAGFGSFFQKYAPGFWGIWFSALLFAWVHTLPTLGNLLQGNMGLPLGPFLLGFICEYLRVVGRSLIPVVLFHMVCNGTVVAFSLLDARWMDWLSLLYS